ncbi:MASE3 domain-containing protein, partial [Candidatus Electronema sp. TJ]|uniref:MASE3 domain-containing protein n=1 Tax=Candidatus Electronema sp. TJ TaxID=3401573 RepID=UPI003AA9A463
MVACAIFIFAWNTRHIQTSHYFLFLGIAYLFIGLLDLLHCLTFAGMGIFPPATAAASAQLWLAARSMESCSLLLAFCFIRRKCRVGWTMAAYLLVFGLLLLLIFICPVFPSCQAERSGRLPEFKQQAEYVIAFLLACSLPLLHWHRANFDREVLRLMQAAVLLAIAAELAQTFHVVSQSFASFASHLFRIFSYYSIYRAVIATGLTQPYNTLFRELNTHKEELEAKVRKRTAALQQSRDSLQAEMAERLRTEKELLWELAVNRTLAQLADTFISRSLSVREIEKLAGRAAKELIGCEQGAAKAILDAENDAEPAAFPWDSVLNTRQGFYTNTLATLRRPVVVSTERLPCRNYLHVPAMIGGRAVGRIALADKDSDFTDQDMAAAERLAAVFALAVQRKQMEESLSRSEFKYRSLFNDAPDMIHIVSQEKKIVDVNPAELRTLCCANRDEVVGAPLLDIIHPDFRSRTEMFLDQVLRTGCCVNSYETALLTRNGGQVDVEVSAMPLLENGRVVSVRAIMRDITGRKKEEQERKKLENQLRQARKMEAIGTLAGGIAHDFNNILGPILGYTEMALDALPAGSDVIPWLEEVQRAGGRAKELVRQILAISRKCEQDLQPLRLQPIIKETLKLLRSSIPSTIEIRSRLDPACGAVLADPTRIHQVVMNLCTNAYQAMRETGGLLEIFLEQIKLDEGNVPGRLRLPPGLYLKLEVRDSGPGIPEELLEKIFEPYFTTKPKGEGTGLGLALVQSIALDFGGDVMVSSELGNGAAFQLFLPVIQETPLALPGEEIAPLPGGHERILVVDDDENIAALSRNILESLGYQVTALTSSTEACALFERRPYDFDLLLTDMTMPQMTGAELAAKFLARRPELPVLLCTGFSELIDEHRA